jgi:hypothetical protein
MSDYFSRNCSRCKEKMMVQVAKPIKNGMIRPISGYCNSCGHRFDWLLIRGKAFFHQSDKLTARL